MNRPVDADTSSTVALELFQPGPNTRYSLAAAAHLAGVSRRSLLVYCRAGLVQPVYQPPYGLMEFTEEAIHAVRKIERLRMARGMDVAWIKSLIDLLNEMESLRAEVRFLRNR